MYRSLVAIVTAYYRPRNDGSELEARRSLTHALRQLSAIPGLEESHE